MGLLSALGGLFQNDDGTQNGLQRFGAQIDPQGAYITQQTIAEQLKNKQEQSALAKLSELRGQGVTNPQSILSSLATVDPSYTEKAATLQAQNPLATLLNNGSGQGNQQGPSLASLTGDDLLKALPPSIASQVKGYAEGKLPFSPYTLRSPAGQQIMQLVSQYDPTFDAANYQARAATRKSFTAGPDAGNITALNTALSHASSLQDAYDKLGNTDYGWLNTAKNAVQSASGDTDKQAAISKVQSTAHALSEELAKVFRSTGMAESDVKAWEKQIDTSATPAQSKAVLDSAVELMNGRLSALGEKYNQGMGTTKQPLELLSPEAQKAYQKITGNTPNNTKATGNLSADNASKQNNEKPQISKEDAIAEAKRRGLIK